MGSLVASSVHPSAQSVEHTHARLRARDSNRVCLPPPLPTSAPVPTSMNVDDDRSAARPLVALISVCAMAALIAVADPTQLRE